MTRYIPGIFSIAVLVVLAIIVVDIVSNPEGENCILDDNILLPDRCFVTGCEGDDFCPAETTRPYMIFWEEAASCPGGNFLCPNNLDQ